MISKNTPHWEKTASGLSLQCSIRGVFSYSQSLCRRQALCKFLGPSMDCSVLDREFERRVTDIADWIAIYSYLFTDGSPDGWWLESDRCDWFFFKLVLWGLVRSGFFALWGLNQDRTGFLYFESLRKIEPDPIGPVHYGSYWFQTEPS